MFNNLWDGSGGPVLQGGSTDYMNAVMENSPSGICITDADGVITCFNHAYENLSGMTKQEMIGRNVRDLLKEGLVSSSGSLEVLDNKAPIESKQQFQTGKNVAINSSPILGNNGEIAMVVTHAQHADKVLVHGGRMPGPKQVVQADCLLHEEENPAAVSTHMTQVMRLAREAARTDLPVLIAGEPGSGKKQVAMCICKNSARKEEWFVSIPCGSASEDKLERELFGVSESGDPDRLHKTGLLEMAEGGTVFFDEISVLSLRLQRKLLKLLRDSEIVPVGADTPRKANVRVLASASRNLGELVGTGAFDKELYYCMELFPIVIPPLRSRKEDIPPLLEEIIEETNRKYGKKKSISKSAALALLSHDWPGNVDELRNVVELAAVLSEQDSIQAQDLAIRKAPPPRWSEPRLTGEPISLKDILEDLEYEYILRAYEKYHNVRKAAGCLSMDAATYVRKRKKYAQKARERQQRKGA